MARFIKYESNRRLGWFTPTEETMNAIEECINWAEREVPSQLNFWMSELAFHMALVNQGEARKMSFGPYDPTGKDTSLAWQNPVRRISQTYYLSWKVRQVRPGVAQLYNDSREAFFIEFGINHLGEGRRVRRPIRKLSLLKTLEHMSRTNTYHRIWAQVFKHNGEGFGFHQIVQSPGGYMREVVRGPSPGSFGGPQLGRRLP
jgi:hypothetical protein